MGRLKLVPDGARPVLESRDRHARPMPADPFASIYGDLNWDAPRGPRRCEECGLGEPVAGAYPSALFHFEEVLGDLGGDRSDARILFLLLEPRNCEANFRLAPPTQPASVGGSGDYDARW